MMRIAKMGFAIAVAAATISALAAAPNARPGLWERTVIRQMEGAPPPPVATGTKLTPEQRARIEQMMTARGATAPTTSVVRYCITPEAAQRWDSFAQDNGGEGKCERTAQDESAGSLRMSLVCGGGKQQGTVTLTAAEPNRVRGTITWVRHDDGGDRKTTIEIDSRWLSADCGAVKPGAPQQVKG
jgi:Protein of unknown function (DUF3617)